LESSQAQYKTQSPPPPDNKVRQLNLHKKDADNPSTNVQNSQSASLQPVGTDETKKIENLHHLPLGQIRRVVSRTHSIGLNCEQYFPLIDG
jgi:hypothetical protein